jgi:hypothetical protein
MTTLTGPDALKQMRERHEKRFAAILDKCAAETEAASEELGAKCIQMNSGVAGQPQGLIRRQWLFATGPFHGLPSPPFPHPYAYRNAGVIPVRPIGVITGDLLESIQVVPLHGPDFYSYKAFSDSPYAPYIWAPEGTSKMVPRMFLQDIAAWTEGRMADLGITISRYGLTLI